MRCRLGIGSARSASRNASSTLPSTQKALFTYAFDNDHITSNPMARVKYIAGDRKERDDFTPEERKLILIRAREAEPHVYWVNLVCSFLGTRT